MATYLHRDTQGPCPDGYHVPTKDEWQAVYDAREDLGISQVSDFISQLKLPLTGYRTGIDASVENDGLGSICWTSSVSLDQDGFSYGFDIGVFMVLDTPRASGASLRPFKNSPLKPSSNWTTIYVGSNGSGIYHNASEGVISISSDGQTWITIADKNLGATQVYNDGDTLSEANCGYFYQWGNNYGFAYTGTIETSSDLVDASSYGPGNYYSDDIFITTDTDPYDWSSVQNDNLWGGVTDLRPFPTRIIKKFYHMGVEYKIKGGKPTPTPTYDGLCFTANTAGSTVQLTKTGTPTAVSLETSPDGTTWNDYTIGNTITLANAGDKVYWRNASESDTGFSTNSFDNYYQFAMTGSIAGSGDITSLLNKNGTLTLSDYGFAKLFFGCTALTTPPRLPATNLAYQCYSHLFSGCTALTTAPILPATTLAEFCYSNMFRNCTSLTTPPELPATNLEGGCYSSMFNGCTALTTAPALPGTTTYTYCYSEMFRGCSSLETLPKLYATTLNNACYYYMFDGCSKIKISSTQTGAYQTTYRIPVTGTGTVAGNSQMGNMFSSTGGTFTGTPTINTTYYTSNTVV